MKKLIYLFILVVGFTSCSVESMDSTEDLIVVDAKARIKAQDVDKSMNLLLEDVCVGEAPVFVLNFPQNSKGNGDPKETDVKIQVETSPGVWVSFADFSYLDAGPKNYTYEEEVLEVGTYKFRVKIGEGGYDYLATLTVKNCCEESFTYVDNGDGTYTFKYTAGEDMDDAELVFTFAQSAYVSGLSDEFSRNGNNGQTYDATIDLKKCDVLEYTVTLIPNCDGKGNEKSNVWTDFKVNDVSKKADGNDKFVAACNN